MSQKLKGVHNSLEVIENRKKRDFSKKRKRKKCEEGGAKKASPKILCWSETEETERSCAEEEVNGALSLNKETTGIKQEAS